MVRFIVALILILPSLSRADFYKVDQVPSVLKPLAFDRGRAAALKMESGDYGCSATLISNQGHVLTALHCVADCIGMDTGRDFKNFSYISPRINSIRLGKEHCRIAFSREGRSLGDLDATVVAAGPGLVISSNGDRLNKEIEKNPDRIQRLKNILASGIGIPGDFVILQVPGLANQICMKSEISTAHLSEQVWNIGYPARSYRKNNCSAPGGTAVFSAGQVTYVRTTPVDYNSTAADRLASLRTSRQGMFMSNIDSNEGSSGSGLFNSNGKLIGVLNSSGVSIENMSNSFGPGTNDYRYASGLDFIYQYTNSFYGSAVASSAFNCQ